MLKTIVQQQLHQQLRFNFLLVRQLIQVRFQITLSGGSDGSFANITPDIYIGDESGGPGKRTGIKAFIDNDEASIMAIPGVTDPNVQLSLVAHCENLKSRFAILDIPRDKKKVADVMTHRNIFDTNYAALYNPWLQVFDPLDKRNIFVPPSGSMVGVLFQIRSISWCA